MCTFYVCVCVRLNSVHIAEVGMFVRTPDDDDDERDGFGFAPRSRNKQPHDSNGRIIAILSTLRHIRYAWSTISHGFDVRFSLKVCWPFSIFVNKLSSSFI